MRFAVGIVRLKWDISPVDYSDIRDRYGAGQVGLFRPLQDVLIKRATRFNLPFKNSGLNSLFSEIQRRPPRLFHLRR